MRHAGPLCTNWKRSPMVVLFHANWIQAHVSTPPVFPFFFLSMICGFLHFTVVFIYLLFWPFLCHYLVPFQVTKLLVKLKCH